VVRERDFVHRILSNGQEIYVDRISQFVGIEGVYQGGPRQYAVIYESSGGTACAAMYRVIEFGEKTKISPAFGTCSDLPKISADVSGLRISMPRMDGQAVENYLVYDGRVQVRSTPTPSISGPSAVPDNDLAELVVGKHIEFASRQRAVAIALSRIMGARNFDIARRYAQGGPGTNFERRGEFVVAFACEAHNCHYNNTRWAFDSNGGACQEFCVRVIV